MTPNEFINKFYTDKNYKDKLINSAIIKKSRYSSVELSKQKEDISDLTYNLLFNKVSNEVYPYTKKIKDIF